MSAKPPNGNLGSLLAGWAAGGEKTPQEIGQAFEALDVCGGAYLFLTREDAAKILRSGAKFDKDPNEVIPLDGRASMRLRCKSPVMTKVLTEEVPDTDQRRSRTVKYGLCDRCNGWELAIRTRLRKAAKEAEQKAKTGTRKRGFREDAAE